MQPAPLQIVDFGSSDDPLRQIDSDQARYLTCYLCDLGARRILIEPYYFDRDYLAEFSAFYSTSSRGYRNVCRRVHFFGSDQLDRGFLERALGDANGAESAHLKDAYLGFAVLRPIEHAPLGRTVVAWYSDDPALPPRITTPSREYEAHVAGLKLRVRGLAWQQQDSGVSACASIAVWSMLHSSAFDAHHAIPTTADVTRFAHRRLSLGSRIFPSSGLTIQQLLEAIKECGLAPQIADGDRVINGRREFSRERFASTCAALIRSGYPVLVVGELDGLGGHAVCAVGFRESAPTAPQAGSPQSHDGSVRIVYLHDDNLGPNVRFEIQDTPNGTIQLKAVAPTPRAPRPVADPSASYPVIVPSRLVAATHEDVRTTPDGLVSFGLNAALPFATLIGATVSTRYLRVSEYLADELARVIQNAGVLSRTRIALVEQIAPMSLHLGVVRVGHGAVPLFDVLLDTTELDRTPRVFATVVFQQAVQGACSQLAGPPFNLPMFRNIISGF